MLSPMADCPVAVRRPAFLFRPRKLPTDGDAVAGEATVTPYLVESYSTPPSSSGTSVSTPDCEMMSELEEMPEYKTPIVGYEVMEERARFTVFKVRVEHHSTGRSWYVYRRYTDFARLNRKLKGVFPGLRFSLPSKRWFGSNFDPLFLEDRVLGLQAFVDSIMAHKDIGRSDPVRNFFCLDEPPGPEDSIEESWARCDSLEEVVCQLQNLLKDRNQEVELLKAEVSMLRSQQQALLKSLKVERAVAEVVGSKSFNQLHIDEVSEIDHCNGQRVNGEDTSLEERSTGDGSTGSRERLPPVGENSFPTGEIMSECVEKGFVDSSTPIKQAPTSSYL